MSDGKIPAVFAADFRYANDGIVGDYPYLTEQMREPGIVLRRISFRRQSLSFNTTQTAAKLG
ncbi:hypothetical protein D3C74_325350 [compost metagenome]